MHQLFARYHLSYRSYTNPPPPGKSIMTRIMLQKRYDRPTTAAYLSGMLFLALRVPLGYSGMVQIMFAGWCWQ